MYTAHYYISLIRFCLKRCERWTPPFLFYWLRPCTELLFFWMREMPELISCLLSNSGTSRLFGIHVDTNSATIWPCLIIPHHHSQVAFLIMTFYDRLLLRCSSVLLNQYIGQLFYRLHGRSLTDFLGDQNSPLCLYAMGIVTLGLVSLLHLTNDRWQK